MTVLEWNESFYHSTALQSNLNESVRNGTEVWVKYTFG